MSRLIVKNISKALDAKELTKAFSKMGTVTDCRIATKDGKHRRFCFMGFKTPQQAAKAQAYFNNTYIGTSKVQVDFAKTKDQIQEQQAKRKQRQDRNIQAPKQPQQPIVKKKFDIYKEVVQKSSQQSWNDLLVGEDALVEQKPKKIKKDIKKEKIEAKAAEKGTALEKKTQKLAPVNPIHIKPPKLSSKNEKYIQGPLKVDQTRLFVTNFPNTIAEDQIVGVFQKYGNVTKSKLPKDQNGKLKGFGFFTFEKPEEALRAFSELDNKIIFGRYLHIKPALEDIGGIIKDKKQQEYQQKIKQKFGDSTEDKTSYRKKKKAELRRRLEDTTSWNTLFLNPNTLLEHMAKKHGVTKAQILTAEDLPVKMALIETEIIDQTKDWMKTEGLNLNFLDTDRNLCERSKNIILVKNLNYNTQPNDLKQLFSYYGIVDRLLLCPNKTIALVEFQSEEFAKNAFQQLSYRKFKGNPLYLEWAPINIMTKQKIQKVIQKIAQEQQNKEELGKVLYVKNLNFSTTEEALRKHLLTSGEIRSVKIIKDKQGHPMGYGFVEFSNQQGVTKAIKVFQNSLLQGHTLQLSVSKKNTEQPQNRRKKQQLEFEPTSPKLVVRNVAFQATKQQIKELFKQFGTIKGVRLPKKMDGQHRGFAFVQYETLDQAKQAFISLANSHLYGRKLVIEWEQSSKSN